VRIIGATNRPIEEAVRDRQFRNDLYFRINVLRLTLPPLRERRSDIAVLARHFLENEFGDVRKPKILSLSALQRLEAHSWPGNVRELHNTMQRALLRCHGREILPEHISLANGAAGEDKKPPAAVNFRSAKQLAIEQFEQSYIESLLLRFQGNITRAAREAGKERRAFGRLVKKYGIG
jgi:DNA-binding NtrC family response regulator